MNGMRRAAALGAALITLCLSPIPFSASAHAQERYAAIVVDAATGEVLHEDQADARRYPASLTKMMTLYLLFEAIQRGDIREDDLLYVSANAAAQPPSRVGMQAYDQITVEEAILALVVQSANDVATVVGERLGGSEEHFASMMTARARELGMNNTRFANASGLPDTAQWTTARDMARLSQALWADFPDFYCYFQNVDFRWGTFTARSHNRLLWQVEGVDGLKTGYTRASGYNIATSAERDGRRIFAVVMGGQTAASRDAQTAHLINDAYAAYAERGEEAAPPPVRPPARLTTAQRRDARRETAQGDADERSDRRRD